MPEVNVHCSHNPCLVNRADFRVFAPVVACPRSRGARCYLTRRGGTDNFGARSCFPGEAADSGRPPLFSRFAQLIPQR